jgi:uncharacterized protein YdaU (DUF1376 family)
MYPTDFEADTSHLTLEEDGAYNRLLRLMWITPGCSLPDDNAWIMRRMRCDLETFNRAVLPVINEFMKRQAGRVFSPRLVLEWKKVDITSRLRSEAGKKGGRPKVVENIDNDEKPGLSPEKAGPKQPEPEPYPDKKKSSEPIGSAVFAVDDDFAKQVFDRAVAFLARHGTREAQARSFVGKLRKDHTDTDIFAAFSECNKAGAVDPIPWITAKLHKPDPPARIRAQLPKERQ